LFIIRRGDVVSQLMVCTDRGRGHGARTRLWTGVEDIFWWGVASGVALGPAFGEPVSNLIPGDLGVARYPQEVRWESLLESTKEGLCLMDQVKIGLGHPFFNSGFDRVLVINKDADVFDKGGEILLEQMVQCMHQGVKFCSIVRLGPDIHGAVIRLDWCGGRVYESGWRPPRQWWQMGVAKNTQTCAARITEGGAIGVDVIRVP